MMFYYDLTITTYTNSRIAVALYGRGKVRDTVFTCRYEVSRHIYEESRAWSMDIAKSAVQRQLEEQIKAPALVRHVTELSFEDEAAEITWHESQLAALKGAS